MKIIGTIISSLILLFLVFVLFNLKNCRISKSKLAPIITETSRLIHQLKSQQYDSIYRHLAPEWKKVQDLKGFKEFMMNVESKIGHYVSSKQNQIQVLKTAKGQLAVLSYTCKFTKSKQCLLTMTLIQANEKWKLLRLHFNSPELNQTIKCPKCLTPLALFSKFCSKCGSPTTQK